MWSSAASNAVTFGSTSSPPQAAQDIVITVPEGHKFNVSCTPLVFLPRSTMFTPLAQTSKIKKEAFILPRLVVSQYLSKCKPLGIVPPPSSLFVPRKFIYQTYGGMDGGLLQYIPASRNPSERKTRNMLFPMRGMNPSMPTVPGEPGLLYASSHEILDSAPWSLFCQGPGSNTRAWRYLGEYESVLYGKMTPEMFQNQQQEVCCQILQPLKI